MKTQKKPPALRSLISVVGLLALQSGLALSAFAEGGATGVGGGGDASEIRVNEIRVDILKWIAEGGDQGLRMPIGIDRKRYRDEMNSILAQSKVVIHFQAEPVMVAGTEKTCSGFESEKDRQLHLLCNIARFKATSDSEQYQLIHHEYAGLAGLERNVGAASDYVFSGQLSEYLVSENILRLAIHKKALDLTESMQINCLLPDQGAFALPLSPLNQGNGWSVSFFGSAGKPIGRVNPTDREGTLDLIKLSRAPSRLHPDTLIYKANFEFESTPDEDRKGGGWHRKYLYAVTYYVNMRNPSQSQYEVRGLEKTYANSWTDLFGPSSVQTASSGWQAVRCQIE